MFEGNSQLRASGEAYEYSPEMINEVVKCKEDIIYFAITYFYIQNLDRGKIKIPLWDFQKKLLKVMINPPDNKRHIVVLSARQMSKTTISTIYILHEMLFKKDSNIAILANNERTAREILSRVQMAYMMLPLWLQRGVKEWNKSSVILENGVRILASSTSSNSIRGFSVNTLFIDECGWIADHIWQDFEASVMPTISSGKTSKIIMVSTPNGLNHFYNIYKKAVLGESDFYAVKIPWYYHPDRDDAWKDSMIRNTSKQQFAQEFDCQFLGSSNTLILPEKLETLIPREPDDITKYSGAFQIYEHPKEDCQYVIGVDPSKGTGSDYTVIQVLKLNSENNVEQVAVYRSNYTKIELMPDIIMGISQYYNNCQAMVESNDVGEVLCRDLWNKYNFDGLCNIDKGKLGIRSTRKSKLEGNLLLKQYIDNGWLEIHDKRTIYELSRYVEVSPDVYHAEGQNENDDCVTSLIWALYYLKTDYYDSGATSKDGGSVDFSSFAILDGSIVGNGFGDSSIYESPFGNSGYDGNFYPGSNFF